MTLFESDIRAKQALYSANGTPCSLARALMSDGTLANLLYRLQGFLAGHGLAPLALVPHLLNKWLNGCVIGVKASFGPGFVLIHPVGVVINSSVRGGRNVWLESSVVVGENRGGFPTLGDDVFVGSGAKIIGAVRVASGARIGANAVVLHDVAEGRTVVGIPARAARPRNGASNPVTRESPMTRRLISSGSPFEQQIGYSRAVVVDGWVFVSGTTGFDYATMTISDDVAEQADRCLLNIQAALQQAGSSLADVVRVTYVLPDAAQFERIWPVLNRHFGAVRPAAMMISAGLADARMKIEIEVTARIGSAD